MKTKNFSTISTSLLIGIFVLAVFNTLILATDEKEVHNLIEKGISDYHNSKYFSSIEKFNKAYSIGKDSKYKNLILRFLSKNYKSFCIESLRDGKFDQIIKFLNDSISKNNEMVKELPEQYYLDYALGTSYFCKKKFNEAKLAYEVGSQKIMSEDWKEKFQKLINLTDLAISTQNKEKQSPKDPEIKKMWGKIYFEFGKLNGFKNLIEESINYYKNYLKSDPNNIEILSSLGEAYGWLVFTFKIKIDHDEKFWKEYIGIYDKLISLSPNNAYFHYMLGRFEFLYDKNQIEYLEKAYSLEPNNIVYISQLISVLKSCLDSLKKNEWVYTVKELEGIKELEGSYKKRINKLIEIRRKLDITTGKESEEENLKYENPGAYYLQFRDIEVYPKPAHPGDLVRIRFKYPGREDSAYWWFQAMTESPEFFSKEKWQKNVYCYTDLSFTDFVELEDPIFLKKIKKGQKVAYKNYEDYYYTWVYVPIDINLGKYTEKVKIHLFQPEGYPAYTKGIYEYKTEVVFIADKSINIAIESEE